MKTTLKIEGLKDLDAALGELVASTSSATGKAALRRGLMRAGQPMADHAARLAPGKRLPKSIKVSPKVKNGVGDQAYAAALQAGADKASAVRAKRDALRATKGDRSTVEVFVGPTGAAASMAHLPEFGTAPHTIKVRPKAEGAGKRNVPIGGGEFRADDEIQHPGARPTPFMRPAFEAKKDEALAIIKTAVADEIAKAASRAAKRAAKRKA